MNNTHYVQKSGQHLSHATFFWMSQGGFWKGSTNLNHVNVKTKAYRLGEEQ